MGGKDSRGEGEGEGGQKNIRMITNAVPRSCAPPPTRTERIMKWRGGRKTSPWRVFQPLSSTSSKLNFATGDVRTMRTSTMPKKRVSTTATMMA